MAYQFFVGFEISNVIFILFLIEPYIFLIINRKNIKFRVKKYWARIDPGWILDINAT